ncbi:homoserine kinase [Croceiramulus getboli]|nr:homoserine kinase [Flavobacteriaceae bacterium YJPT1-3]
MKKEVRVFSPATVANVNCGFDLLGFAIQGIGDEMILRKTSKKGEVSIKTIHGATLPLEPERNVAGVAARAMLQATQAPFGVELELYKNIQTGSGIGSSAASAAGAVVGINQFLDQPVDRLELTRWAMKGEAVASGNEHADNVAPSIYGGITLICSYEPLQIIQLPVPEALYVTVIHPQIKIETKAARAKLPESVPLKKAIRQSGHLAGFVSALYTSDYELMKSTAQDILIEPHRKSSIPEFDRLRKEALDQGALVFGISGSGPSIFALSKGNETAINVEYKLKSIIQSLDLDVQSYSGKICTQGSYICSHS